MVPLFLLLIAGWHFLRYREASKVEEIKLYEKMKVSPIL